VVSFVNSYFSTNFYIITINLFSLDFVSYKSFCNVSILLFIALIVYCSFIEETCCLLL